MIAIKRIQVKFCVKQIKVKSLKLIFATNDLNFQINFIQMKIVIHKFSLQE